MAINIKEFTQQLCTFLNEEGIAIKFAEWMLNAGYEEEEIDEAFANYG